MPSEITSSLPVKELNNGVQMPMVGLGTWRTPPDVTKKTVTDALKMGYRHIDCAHIYGNEAEVGEAIEEQIKQGLLTRDELFVTSKLWNTFHHPDMVREACLTSLKDLRLSYLDLYLIHWPTAYKDGHDLHPKDENGKIIFSNVDYLDTWIAMEELVDDGLCKSIGLSNFNMHQIRRVLDHTNIPPANLQIEMHPYFNQSRMVRFCMLKRIAITAYSPLGSGHSPYNKPGEYPVLAHPTILELAEKYERTPAQIILSWHLNRGISVIPRSVDPDHMLDNLTFYDLKLEPQDLESISAMDINGRFMTWEIAAGHPNHPFENDEGIWVCPMETEDSDYGLGIRNSNAASTLGESKDDHDKNCEGPTETANEDNSSGSKPHSA